MPPSDQIIVTLNAHDIVQTLKTNRLSLADVVKEPDMMTSATALEQLGIIDEVALNILRTYADTPLREKMTSLLREYCNKLLAMQQFDDTESAKFNVLTFYSEFINELNDLVYEASQPDQTNHGAK